MTGARVIYLGLPDCHDCLWFKDGLCHMFIKIPDRTDASSCGGFMRQRPFAPRSPAGRPTAASQMARVRTPTRNRKARQ